MKLKLLTKVLKRLLEQKRDTNARVIDNQTYNVTESLAKRLLKIRSAKKDKIRKSLK